MFSYYFNIGLVYLLVGFSVALISYFGFKKRFFGNFWGALAVCVLGSFLGGVFEVLFRDVIHRLANINNSVNIFPPIISAVILAAIFTHVSEKRG